jgi:hypothetical protein
MTAEIKLVSCGGYAPHRCRTPSRDMPPQVGHHVRCRACGYDLYTLPLDGKCPECGQKVPRRRGIEKAKNPRRVNGQLRGRLRRHRLSLWYAIPMTLVAVAVMVASFWFHLPRWIRVPAWIFSVTGVLGLFELWFDIEDAKQKMVPDDPPPPPRAG